MVLDEPHEWVALFLNVRKKNIIRISVCWLCCILDTWLSTYQGSLRLEQDSGLLEVYRSKRRGISLTRTEQQFVHNLSGYSQGAGVS
jgi:hypothetical protein